MLNGCNNLSIQALVFLTLFLFDCSDLTNRDRRNHATMIESSKHMLKHYYFDNETNLPRFPFAERNR